MYCSGSQLLNINVFWFLKSTQHTSPSFHLLLVCVVFVYLHCHTFYYCDEALINILNYLRLERNINEGKVCVCVCVSVKWN